MTVVLIAVYVPIGFQGGLTGALFTEFAFTLAGAVTVSAMIALTLSPMMCSRLLKPHHGRSDWEARLVRAIDRASSAAQMATSGACCAAWLTPVTRCWSCGARQHLLLYGCRQVRARAAGGPGLRAICRPAADATLQQKALYASRCSRSARRSLKYRALFQIDAPGAVDRRPGVQALGRSAAQGADRSSRCCSRGERHRRRAVAVFQPPSLPGAFGLPVQFVDQDYRPLARLNEVAQQLPGRGAEERQVRFHRHRPEVDPPQSTIMIDREKTAQLGLTMSEVGTALGSMLGGGYVNYFSIDARSYKVIPQVAAVSRLNAEQLLDLSTIAHHRRRADSRCPRSRTSNQRRCPSP